MFTRRSATHDMHSSVSPGSSFNNVQRYKHSCAFSAVVSLVPTKARSASVGNTRVILKVETMMSQYTMP